jgi:hypothetical protein
MVRRACNAWEDPGRLADPNGSQVRGGSENKNKKKLTVARGRVRGLPVVPLLTGGQLGPGPDNGAGKHCGGFCGYSC